MPNPNKERIRLLVEDLRNPDNRQVHGHLEDLNGNCCLGRACRVAMANGVVVKTESTDCYTTKFGGFSGYLPDTVVDWFGFGVCNPYLHATVADEDVYVAAVRLNDEFELTFPEIADAFERTFLTGKD